MFDCEECGKCDKCLGIHWTPYTNAKPISNRLAKKLQKYAKAWGHSARRSLEKVALESMGIK